MKVKKDKALDVSCKWYFCASDNLSRIQEYFAFNNTHYEYLDLWNDVEKINIFPTDVINQSNTVFCLDLDSLILCLKNTQSKESLFDFLANNNKIIIYQDIDLLPNIWHYGQDYLEALDEELPIKGSVIILSESKLTPDYYKFQKITFDSQLSANPWFFGFGLLARSPVTIMRPKTECAYDFLCLSKYTKKRRKWLLFSALHKNLKVTTKTLSSIDKDWNKIYLGSGKWPDADLVAQCYFDIVPEMMCEDGYYFTEKIARPILTKTPFLVFSTPGYLEMLKQYGFKTFGRLIDESYDQEPDLEKRTIKIIESAEKISKIGAKKVYQELQPEIEHNFNHLMLLKGKHMITSDNILYKIFNQYNL